MFDLGERIGTIIEKVPRLSAVDPDHSQQQLSTQTQSHGRLALAYDVLYIVLEIRLQDILLCEFALQVGSQPNTRQRSCLGQKRL
jgi:hypothetical protein